MGECVIYHPLRPPSVEFRQVIIILDNQFCFESGPLRSTPVESGPTSVESGPTPVNSGRIRSDSGRIRSNYRRIRSYYRRIRSNSGPESGRIRYRIQFVYIREDSFALHYFPKLRSVEVNDYDGSSSLRRSLDTLVLYRVDGWTVDSRCGYGRSDCKDDLLFDIC